MFMCERTRPESSQGNALVYVFYYAWPQSPFFSGIMHTKHGEDSMSVMRTQRWEPIFLRHKAMSLPEIGRYLGILCCSALNAWVQWDFRNPDCRAMFVSCLGRQEPKGDGRRPMGKGVCVAGGIRWKEAPVESRAGIAGTSCWFAGPFYHYGRELASLV